MKGESPPGVRAVPGEHAGVPTRFRFPGRCHIIAVHGKKHREFFSFLKIIPTFFVLLSPLDKTSVGWRWEILRRRAHGASVGQESHFTV